MALLPFHPRPRIGQRRASASEGGSGSDRAERQSARRGPLAPPAAPRVICGKQPAAGGIINAGTSLDAIRRMGGGFALGLLAAVLAAQAETDRSGPVDSAREREWRNGPGMEFVRVLAGEMPVGMTTRCRGASEGCINGKTGWEHAARSGTVGAHYGELDEIAWWWGNSGGKTHRAGLKRSNG